MPSVILFLLPVPFSHPFQIDIMGQKNSPTYPQQNRPSQNAPSGKGAHTFTAYAWYVRLYSSNTVLFSCQSISSSPPTARRCKALRLLQLKSRALLWVGSLYHKFWKLSIHPPWRCRKYIHGREKSKLFINRSVIRWRLKSATARITRCNDKYTAEKEYMCGSPTLIGNYDRLQLQL